MDYAANTHPFGSDQKMKRDVKLTKKKQTKILKLQQRIQDQAQDFSAGESLCFESSTSQKIDSFWSKQVEPCDMNLPAISDHMKPVEELEKVA